MSKESDLKYLEQRYQKNKEKKFIPLKCLQFEVHLTDHCNLNCASCDNLSPIAKPFFMDITELEMDMKKLSELFADGCNYIRLLGGEPLLHPDVAEIITSSRRIFPESRIELVTNGLLLEKMSDEFYHACHNCRLIISISKYPVNLDYNLILKVLGERNIECFFNNTDEKRMYKYPISLFPVHNPKENFILCNRSNNCISLKHGKLATCSLLHNICSFNKYFNTNIRVNMADYIDIYEADTGEEILKKLAKPISLCRYCNLWESQFNLIWKQSKKQITEWV